MASPLDRKRPQIKTGFLFVDQAVALVARMVATEPFQCTSTADLIPFYLRTKKVNGVKTKVPVRTWWERNKSGYELFFEELEIDQHLIPILPNDFEQLRSALRLLVQFVLDGVVSGRIEPSNSKTLELDESYAQRFRDQKLTAYCTSRIRLHQNDRSSKPALLLFEKSKLEAAVSRYSAVEGHVSTKGANGVTKPLSVRESERLKQAAMIFLSKIHAVYGDSEPPKFNKEGLYRFFCGVVNLPTRQSGDGEALSEHTKRYRSSDTVMKALADVDGFEQIRARRGRPIIEAGEKRVALFEALNGEKLFENHVKILIP